LEINPITHPWHLGSNADRFGSDFPATSGVFFWANRCRQCGCGSSLTSLRNQGLAAMRVLATGFDHAVVMQRQFSQKEEAVIPLTRLSFAGGRKMSST
jgi:hypothetical protein